MAMILDAFLSKFTEILVKMVHDKVGMLLCIPGQIEKLCKTVHDIQRVLADAERKQSKGSAIEWWLMQLKDVMYDADDVIDLCQIKAKERLAGSSSHSSSNARCGFTFTLASCFCNPFFAHEIGSRIKDINSRLEEIAKKKTDLGLIELQNFPEPSNRVRRVDSIISRKTDPSVVLADIVGDKIDEDTEMLVNWLTEEDKGVRENVGVAAIVGIGGIGKTTLAKRIFNDPRIREEFQLKIWVCVSKEVNGLELLKCVIREAGGEHGATQERSELVPSLERLIQKKKFLLVLDDVWQESRAVWDDLLRTPMSGGVHGSRVLVTTRDEGVAKRMRAEKLHHVEKLSDEDGWSLLTKQVVLNGIESEIQNLKEIGMQIVKKCDGLPLAIKSIGGVLCTKGNTRDSWEAVLKSNVWSMDGLLGDVHHALYLSYEDLPPHLKQCFIFCSLFPEDYLFLKTELIYMWFAEGFLKDEGNFWELGIDYYNELLLRNFLEDTKSYYAQSECKMHDILWSFARQLGKYENCVLREGQVLSRYEGSLKVRRLSIEGNVVNNKLIKKEKGLRTLLLEPEIPLGDFCKAFSNLRILNLCFSDISSLPNSLGDLVHLRYLDVSDSKIRNLPNSIGNLKCLVYLELSGCKDLSHVPRSIINLKELRYLNFVGSGVQAIPAGLNKLDKLVELLGFKPDKNSFEGFNSLDGLESLSQLRLLWLQDLERVSNRNIAKRANLRSKNQLQELTLEFTSLSWEEQLSQTNEEKITTEDVVNELFPPRCLKSLIILNYFGNHLPNWLNLGANLLNLRYLRIENCACFEEFASLGQLPNLNHVLIEGAYSVVSVGEDVSVGEEFLGGNIESRDTITVNSSSNPAFPKLTHLEFTMLLKWKEWQWNKGVPAMPKLNELFIEACPQLRSLPEGLSLHATSLEYLGIKEAENLITVENFPSIKRIVVIRNPNLERILNLPSISSIKIEECPNLKTLENLESLQRMTLDDYEMKTLPEYLMTIMPQKLTIWCSDELLLKIATQRESCSEWFKFKHIAKVKICKKDESLYATYQKTPFSFATNVDASMN